MSLSTKNVLLLLVGLAILVFLLWLLLFLRPLLISLTISSILAYLLNPLVAHLTKRFHGRHSLAASVIFAFVLVLFAGLFILLGTVVWEQWPRLQQEFREVTTLIQRWLTRPFFFFGFILHPEAILENVGPAWQNALSTLTIGSDGLLSSLTNNLLWALVVVVSFYYFLKDGHRIQPYLLNLAPEPERAAVQQLFADIDSVWGVFLRVQLLIFFVLAFLIVSSTTLIIWLFRQGLLPLSPIGLIVLIIVVYVAIQQVDNLWLRPQLMGHALKLHPAIIFVGLITGLALSGLVGALLIIPILATAKVMVRFAYHFLLPLLLDDQQIPEQDIKPDAPTLEPPANLT